MALLHSVFRFKTPAQRLEATKFDDVCEKRPKLIGYIATSLERSQNEHQINYPQINNETTNIDEYKFYVELTD